MKSLETRVVSVIGPLLFAIFYKNRHNLIIHDFAFKIVQFIEDIVFYIPAKFQSKLIIYKIVMIFF